MKFKAEMTELKTEAKHTLIIGIYEQHELTKTAQDIDKITDGALSKFLKQNHFTGKAGETLALYDFGNHFHHLILVGLGKPKKLSAAQFRKILISLNKDLHNIPLVVSYLVEASVLNQSLHFKIRQLLEMTSEGLYRFDMFKSQKDPAPKLKEMVIHVPKKEDLNIAAQTIREGQAIIDGVILTKNLGNLPSNICTPSFLADQAKDLAKQYSSLSVKILDEKDMEKLGMGALLGVSQGSAEPAKLICLEYKGSKNAPIALVGKGVTFDTGGNSLKLAENMVGMKYDMCGAAAVLGTMKSVLELKLPIHLIGVIPAVENMPGGTAYKPEDILTSMAGKTIEVMSTDAEGRLALCDALTYCERYKPEIVIDIATLTGAVVIALGFHASGLMSNNKKLANDLLKAGEESFDRAWQLPLWEEYQEQIKSPFADIANLGGRPAGTITAGCFLSRFATKFQWAHLDVAGTAAMMMGTSERKATGRPVPLLTQYLIDRSQ